MIKVEMKNDELILTPSDGIENYALKEWFKNYTGEPSTALLRVDTFVETEEI